MTKVELRISNVASGAANAQARLPMSIVEKDAVVFRSPLAVGCSISEHVVWLWGHVQRQRRLLKRFQSEGALLEVVCITTSTDVRLTPEAAEMIHLVHAELVIELKSHRGFKGS